MTYQFARIDLIETDYQATVPWRYLEKNADTVALCQDIYRTYCIYKHFGSVMPLFASRLLEPSAEVLGYFDGDTMVAFSLMRVFDEHNLLADQFAWTYHRPRMRLGIETMKTECSIYRARGFRYLYLEQAHLYKQEMAGFQLLGPMT
jgi:hypothetical protein